MPRILNAEDQAEPSIGIVQADTPQAEARDQKVMRPVRSKPLVRLYFLHQKADAKSVKTHLRRASYCGSSCR
ncbi:hypothetical protein CA13_07530 [Planctomycetes bacterium CA13]|uniref:Uncharacterized protein n=1 Tax=Novipirellula herctigrandis TaxID=2527986 RepID=A0A5C5YXT1_9BACT|nr:hypothetical protein CA13_07530 [Planctomycetes bacterium CA13]